MDPRLLHPFTCVIAGPSGCGKTQFVLKLIQHVDEMIYPPPQRIVWCFGEFQKGLEQLKGVELCEGLPDSKSFDGRLRTLLIIDDLMSETNSKITSLFTKGSHHRDISIIYITQNLFYAGKETRTMNLNTHYIVLFKNPRDVTQVAHLGRQMFPGAAKYLQEAFSDATKLPHGYLLVDLKPATADDVRLRTNIFPSEQTFVYLKKV